MSRIIMIGVIALVTLLTGCASFKQDAGFDVQSKTAFVLKARQEPWHNVVVMGDLREQKEIAVAVVNLPEYLPTKWKEELVDKARTYTVKLPDGRLLRKPLERVVMRAVAYTETGRFVELFDAVISERTREFYVLLPSERVEEVKRYQLAILSSDGTWLMTTQREMVELKEGQDLNKLPQGFFAEHPSPLRQVIPVKRSHGVFQGLLATFPDRYTTRGVVYSGRPDADTILSQFTSLETASDKIISCGSLAISPGMVTFGVALSVVRNISVATQKDCLNPEREKAVAVETEKQEDL